MKFSYRITKYHSYFDTNNKILSSQPREWTSFCDVENGMVSLEEYEKIESEYIRIILEICKFVDIRYLKIKELENFNHLKEYKNNQRIYIENNLTELLKLILREKISCKLWNRNCEFHFGYDYYLYCVCNKDLTKLFNELRTFLNIENFISPYLKNKQIMRIKPF
jgi:hypothetical protein